MTDDTVQVKLWIGHGTGVLTNTECLDFDDPMHPYNQILSQGKKPESFGYEHPLAEEFRGKDRTDLIEEIMFLRKELSEVAKAGFY